MTDTYVILDTNLLPTKGNLESAFWRSFLQLCRVKGFRAALVDVMLDEDVNRKTELAQEWITSMTEAQKGLSDYIDFATYIPSVVAVATAWRNSLSSAFEVIALNGNDAKEALRREALRIWPAQNGKGARDSAMWLTVVRLIAEGNNVFLLTNNTDDFGHGGLHDDLEAELKDLPGSLQYLTNNQHFVEAIAEKVTPWALDNAALAATLGPIAQDHLLSYLEVVEYESFNYDDIESGVIQFSDSQVVSAYLVDGRGVARVRGRFTVSKAEGPVFISASFDTWSEFDAETRELDPAPFDTLNIDTR